MQQAQSNAQTDLRPSQDALSLTRQALQQNQTGIDSLIQSISSGNAQGALWGLLNEKAAQLKVERERLMFEQRRLAEALAPLEEHFDAEVLRGVLTNFAELAAEAEPEELQRLMRFAVRRIEWMPEGGHRVQLYHLAKPSRLPGAKAGRQLGFILMCQMVARRGFEPLVFRMRI